MTSQKAKRKSQKAKLPPVIPSEARNLALSPSFADQSEIPCCARNDTLERLPRRMVVRALALTFAICDLPFDLFLRSFRSQGDRGPYVCLRESKLRIRV